MQLFKLANIQKDPEDPRDILFQVDYTKQLPPSVDLRPFMPPIRDQGSIGKCTGEATTAAAEAFLIAGGKYQQLADQFNYWTSRYLLGGNVPPTQDTGSQERFALRAGMQFGIPPITAWPDNDATVETQPPQTAYDAAQNYKFGKYARIPTESTAIWWSTERLIYSIKYALAKGYAVLFSFEAGQAIFTLKNDDVYGPIGANNPTDNAGHEVLIVGYANVGGNLVFIVRNSWGVGYCMAGYFYMSPLVITENAYDVWVPMSFAGVNAIGPDLTTDMPAPDKNSTMADMERYAYRVLFGREPDFSGEAWWRAAMVDWLLQQFRQDAQEADKAFMADNGVQ